MRWWYGLIVSNDLRDHLFAIVPSDDGEYLLLNQKTGKVLLKLTSDDIVRIVSGTSDSSYDSLALLEYLNARAGIYGNIYISASSHRDLCGYINYKSSKSTSEDTN